MGAGVIEKAIEGEFSIRFTSGGFGNDVVIRHILSEDAFDFLITVYEAGHYELGKSDGGRFMDLFNIGLLVYDEDSDRQFGEAYVGELGLSYLSALGFE